MSECAACGNTAYTPAGENCPAVGYQKVNICAPVTVSPYAYTTATKTHCCGDAALVSGGTKCSGKKNGTCTFTISQTICVEIPVFFGATATVDDTYVDCLGASAKDICTDCTALED